LDLRALGFLGSAWWPSLGLLLLTLVAGIAGADPEAPRIKSSELKAAFVYNFTKFVEWPAGSLPDAGAPMTIGVLGGDSSILAELRSIVENREVNGRSIVVRLIADPADVQDVQLLFVGVGHDAEFLALRATLDGRPVLTVGDSPAFVDAGGAIAFVEHGTKLRFEINMASAERARLKVSAQLQELAVAVRRTP
jgi:hypothetical protein